MSCTHSMFSCALYMFAMWALHQGLLDGAWLWWLEMAFNLGALTWGGAAGNRFRRNFNFSFRCHVLNVELQTEPRRRHLGPQHRRGLLQSLHCLQSLPQLQWLGFMMRGHTSHDGDGCIKWLRWIDDGACVAYNDFTLHIFLLWCRQGIQWWTYTRGCGESVGSTDSISGPPAEAPRPIIAKDATKVIYAMCGGGSTHDMTTHATSVTGSGLMLMEHVSSRVFVILRWSLGLGPHHGIYMASSTSA